MIFDDIDIKVLRENFDDETINGIDKANVARILEYLVNDGVYYAKDLFITFLDIFYMPFDDFVEKFEMLKKQIGDNYVDKLGEDMGLFEFMYN